MSQNALNIADNDNDYDDPVKLLANVKAEIVLRKQLKTTLYSIWKATPASDKPAARAKYDEVANKLKLLYTQQKTLQKDIKSTSRKGKKRVVPDGESSRRSPRKKAKSCDDTTTTGTRATSNTAVDLDLYSPTPFESTGCREQPAHLVPSGTQSQSLHNSGSLPQVLSSPGPSPQAPVLPIQPKTDQASDAPVSPDLPAIRGTSPGISGFPVPMPATAETTAMPTAVTDSTHVAIMANKSLPAAPGPPITATLVPLFVTAASVPPLTSASPRINVSAVAPVIATSPSLQDTTAVPLIVTAASVPPLTSASPRINVSAVAPPAIATSPSLQDTTVVPQPATGPVPVPYHANLAPVPYHTDPELVPPLTSATPRIIVSAVAPVIATSPSLQDTTAAPHPVTETLTVPLNTLAAPVIAFGGGPAVHSSFAATTPSSHQGAATVLAVHRAEGPEKSVVPPAKKGNTVTRGKRQKKDNLKIDRSITLWRDLSKEQKGKLLYEGKKAFNKWVARGQPIPFRTRVWARRESSFMPELATHSKELAVMTLTTRVGNRMCHYHTRYTNHTSSDSKAAEDDLYPKVTGMPYTRSAVKARIKKEPDNDNEPDDDDDGNNTDVSSGSYRPRTFAPIVYDNAMNCGCALEEVLLDFFFWKDTVARSPTTGMTEGWGGDMMDPRTRTLVCTLLKGQPAIELDWLYEINAKGDSVSLSQMYCKQSQALNKWYKNRELEVNPPASDSENESLLPAKTKDQSSRVVPSGSGSKGKKKVVESKADFHYKK